MVPLTGGGAPEIVLSGPLLVALLIAAAAGAVSFFSPCCLPLVPGYLSYVAGMSGGENQPARNVGVVPMDEPRIAAMAGGETPPQAATTLLTTRTTQRPRSRTVAGAVLFVGGFAVVFTSYGVLFGALGAWLITYQGVLVRILGVVTIVLGLMFAGVLSRVPLAGRTVRLNYQPRTGLMGAPLVGILFGLGWTPCIGPTLAAVLTLATSSADAGRGAALSFAYSAGLGIPFIVAAMSMQKVMASFGWARRHARAVMRAGGVMLVFLGLLQVSGLWLYVMSWLQTFIVGWTVPL
jgi:cytochrome c-type biogenesis protein